MFDMIQNDWIQIIGDAYGVGFQSYVLKYGEGRFPSSWNVLDSVFVPVSNGKLADWNGSNLSGIYTLKLTVYSASGRKLENRIELILDKDIFSSWSMQFKGNDQVNPIAVDDIDNDGKGEIVSKCGCDAYVFNPDGSVKEGWPYRIGIVENSTNGILNNFLPAIGDIDDDGDKEIALTIAYNLNPTGVIFHHDGSVLNGWSIWSHDYFERPVLADLDNNNIMELIYNGGNAVWAFHADGSIVQGWPQKNEGGEECRSVAVGDIDNDGNKEVIAWNGGVINIWHKDGTMAHGWPQRMNESLSKNTSPILADVDADSELEIITGCRGNSTTGALVYVWKGDGTLENGWPQVMGSCSGNPDNLIVGDLDDDHLLEIIATGWIRIENQSDAGALYVWKYNGSIINGWPRIYPGESTDWAFPTQDPLVADINGDGVKEIIAAIRHWVDWNQDGCWRMGEENEVRIHAFKPDGSEILTDYPKKI
ncbi:VCBS repeat-containing protein, partial [bacterium]|nr:VCBS repeat-containing protein [bacterium]